MVLVVFHLGQGESSWTLRDDAGEGEGVKGKDVEAEEKGVFHVV